MKHTAFSETAHRPWPVPTTRWVWRQSWQDLLFAHWRVPAAKLRPHIPAELELQEYDGSAWIGVVPFRMEGVMLRPLPDLPGISAFPELNVRTYVRHAHRHGVWFFSLDATNPLAVLAGRTLFHLPYFRASIDLSDDGERIRYRCRRTGGGPEFSATYGPTGDVYRAREGTLEHWLTERYCLFAADGRGRVSVTEVHHVPWPLQAAEASIATNAMTSPIDVSLEGVPLVHFARRIDVVVWPSESLAPRD